MEQKLTERLVALAASQPVNAATLTSTLTAFMRAAEGFTTLTGEQKRSVVQDVLSGIIAMHFEGTAAEILQAIIPGAIEGVVAASRGEIVNARPSGGRLCGLC